VSADHGGIEATTNTIDSQAHKRKKKKGKRQTELCGELFFIICATRAAASAPPQRQCNNERYKRKVRQKDKIASLEERSK
jgi:hypothetical protein